MNFIPYEDGTTHINAYSNGKTMTGRFLSNFAFSPIDTEDGEFASIEAYWYWMKTLDERIRPMYGVEAKKFGRSLPVVSRVDQQKIKKAVKIKIEKYYDLLKGDRHWEDLSLPIVHYYVYDGKMRPAGGEWLMEYIEQIRFDKTG